MVTAQVVQPGGASQCCMGHLSMHRKLQGVFIHTYIYVCMYVCMYVVGQLHSVCSIIVTHSLTQSTLNVRTYASE